MTDIEIIESILKGNSLGYSILFKKYRRQVFNYIKQRVFNILDAEDLLMITFEKAFAKLHTYKPNYKFSTWLIQIAKYTVIDFIRTEAIKVRKTDEIDNYRFIKDTSNTPYQILLEKELKDLINGQINKLPKKSKPVMKLHFEGYKDEEIVDKLNMMHGNVRCILTRAKEKLKSLKTILHEEDNILCHAVA